MGPQTVGAVLDAVFRIKEAAATFVTQTVQRAIAEQTAESFRIRTGMAGKIFAVLMLEKIIIRHIVPPFQSAVKLLSRDKPAAVLWTTLPVFQVPGG